MCELILSNVGLILNFMGSIFIARSVTKHPGDANTNGKPLAVIRLKLFWFGIMILATGFLWSIGYSGYMHYK